LTYLPSRKMNWGHTGEDFLENKIKSI